MTEPRTEDQGQEAASSPAEGGPTESQDPKPADVVEMIAKLNEKLDRLQEAAKPTTTSPTPPPASPSPPPPKGSRITKDDYDALAAWAAERAQEAERYKLAAQYGLKPEDLDGDYASPAEMKAHAELLALRRQISVLERRLEETPPAPTTTEGGAEEAPGDVGGPTSQQNTSEAELQRRYEEARQMGRSAKARRHLLETIYQDPSKAIPLR